MSKARSPLAPRVVLQAAAEGALNGMQSVVENLRLMFENNRDITMQELKTFSGIRTTKPEGTFYVLPDFRAYSNNSVELSKFLLQKALVVTVPGKEFGMEGYIRLSYAGSVKDITTAVERMKWALRSKLAQRNLHWRPQVDQGLAMNNLLDIKTPGEAQAAARKSEFGLENHGLTNLNKVYWNLAVEALYEEAIFRGEGKITLAGPLVVNTGKHTARAANDKFVVREPSSEGYIWWGQYNRPYSAEKFDELFSRVQGYLQGRDVFIQDCYEQVAPLQVALHAAEQLVELLVRNRGGCTGPTTRALRWMARAPRTCRWRRGRCACRC